MDRNLVKTRSGIISLAAGYLILHLGMLNLLKNQNEISQMNFLLNSLSNDNAQVRELDSFNDMEVLEIIVNQGRQNQAIFYLLPETFPQEARESPLLMIEDILKKERADYGAAKGLAGMGLASLLGGYLTLRSRRHSPRYRMNLLS